MVSLERYNGPELPTYTEPVRGYRLYKTRYIPFLAKNVLVSMVNQHSKAIGLNDIFDEERSAATGAPVTIDAVCKRFPFSLGEVFKFEDFPGMGQNTDHIGLAPNHDNSVIFKKAAPIRNCTCGWWGVYDVNEAWKAVGSRDSMTIMFAVEASGVVVLGEKGFRAQRLKLTHVVNDVRVYNYEASFKELHTKSFSDPFVERLVGSREPALRFSSSQIRQISNMLPAKIPVINDIRSHLLEFPPTNPRDYL